MVKSENYLLHLTYNNILGFYDVGIRASDKPQNGWVQVSSKSAKQKVQDCPSQLTDAVNDLKRNIGSCHRDKVSRTLKSNPPSSNLHHFVTHEMHRQEACYLPSTSSKPSKTIGKIRLIDSFSNF